jgi:hypothetical protein
MEDLRFEDVAVNGVTVQHDEPERCRELLLEFLKGASVMRTHIFETGDGKSPASNSQ